MAISQNGVFSNEDLRTKFTNNPVRLKQKYFITPHKGFEIVKLPNGARHKLAYNELHPIDYPDIDIELAAIGRWEPVLKSSSRSLALRAHRKLKFHYKRAISLLSPKYAKGWNRWSENILDMFLYDKLHRVLWGSGNCGKSAVMGLLLYTKWRVRPRGRMVVIATKVVADSKARVFGYIKEIHAGAPASRGIEFRLAENQHERGIYTMILDEKTPGQKIKNDRGCIVSLPIKVRLDNKRNSSELGANLMGRHPDDLLIIGFDEGQELPALILEEKIFNNWYTNTNIEVVAWGNPSAVDYYDVSSQDLLYRLGMGGASEVTVRNRQKNAERTDMWITKDTICVRFSMLDSPKDDIEEVENYILDNAGQKVQRLWFLAGRASARRIEERTSPNSAAWFSQVLGFPYVDFQGSRGLGVITPSLVSSVKAYPLSWHTPMRELEYFMGVDPSLTGYRDDCAIVVARVGTMLDGRVGIDFEEGKYCVRVRPTDTESEFVDDTIEKMWELAQRLRIPLKNIGIDTHGTCEVFRYAFNHHIENLKKWEMDSGAGQSYSIISPAVEPTDRLLFKVAGKMHPAKEIVTDITTELWTAFRCAVISRQVFNVPEFILQQFYNRNLFMRGGKVKFKIETKKELEKRGIKSPNFGDATCYLLETIRRNGKFTFKFINSGNYKEKLGPSYNEKIAHEKMYDKLRQASQLMGVNLVGDAQRFNAPVTGKVYRAPRPVGRSMFTIDVV